MRVETTERTLYTAGELQEMHPDGFERAREWYYEAEASDNWAGREVFDSLFALWEDLQAYNEDPTELGFDGTDMLEGAAACLYLIGYRLASSLWEELDEAASEDDEDEEDEQ